MDADFSIELGREDPVLDFPWSDPEGKLAYFDVKRHPEHLWRIMEVKDFPEFGPFLQAMNSATSLLESAKCDAWSTDELGSEEEIFCASHKFSSYVDLVFTDPEQRASFPWHERFAKQLVELLRRTPETPSSVEVCVRRCCFTRSGETVEGFYFSFYVSGYGDDEARSRQNWAIGLKLAGNAILQLSAEGLA